MIEVHGLAEGFRKYAVLALRLSLGWIFLWAGAEKIYLEITTGQLATAGYLQFAVRGPFAEFFQSLSGNVIVDALLVWGLTLVGISLITGLFVRMSSVAGALIMLSMYLSAFPPEHNPLMDEHIAYIVSFAVLASFKAGRFAGLDQIVTGVKSLRGRPWITRILG